MLTLLPLLLACGSAPRDDLQSQPVEPTVDLTTAAAPAPVATLSGLLPNGTVALPTVLAGLEIGQTEAAAREALDTARHRKIKQPKEQVIQGVTVVGAVLNDFETVGVTLLIEEGRLSEVDLSLPVEEALGAVAGAWGEPAGSTTSAAGDQQPVWRGEALQATLIEAKEKAILKFAAVRGEDG